MAPRKPYSSSVTDQALCGLANSNRLCWNVSANTYSTSSSSTPNKYNRAKQLTRLSALVCLPYGMSAHVSYDTGTIKGAWDFVLQLKQAARELEKGCNIDGLCLRRPFRFRYTERKTSYTI